MTEDDLRAAFARHEYLVPDARPIRAAIDVGIARRRSHRRAAWSGAAALAVAIAIALPMTAARLVSAPAGPPQPAASTGSGPLNLLIVGHDRRAGAAEPVRADAIVLAHVDRARQRAYLVSLPRDLLLAPDRKLGWEYADGGMPRLAAVVSQLTGVPLDGTVAVSFDGLVSVTNAVGGVHLCVDQRIVSAHVGRDRNGAFLAPAQGGRPIVYEPGCRNFVGWEALDYLRQRLGLPNGALHRDKHVRDYLKALAQKLGSSDTLTNPVRFGQVAGAAGRAVEVDLAHGRTLVGLAHELRQVRPDDLGSIAVPWRIVDSPTQSGVGLGAGATELFVALREDRVAEWVAAHP